MCVCCVGRLSPNFRILSSLFVILLVFVVTTVLVKVDMSDRQVEFFVGTMASVAVVSGASNLFSGSVFGISGHFPMRVSQALISGTSVVLIRSVSGLLCCFCCIYNSNMQAPVSVDSKSMQFVQRMQLHEEYFGKNNLYSLFMYSHYYTWCVGYNIFIMASVHVSVWPLSCKHNKIQDIIQ